MKRCLALSALLLACTCVSVGQANQHTAKRRATWYEGLLERINPQDIDYGAAWAERKREFIGQLSNPYLQYSLGATIAVVGLLTFTFVQRVSHRRALTIAAHSLTDVLNHDAYSRVIAEDAIRRYNDHIEACNRVIESGQESKESDFDVLKRQLADIRQENASLREELAKKSRQGATDPAASEATSAPAQYLARINALEKQLREEQRKNQKLKGTSVDDHRA